MNIYVVYSETGEYDDWKKDIYQIFSNRESAEACMNDLIFDAKELGILDESNFSRKFETFYENLDKFFDKYQIRGDYTGIKFSITEFKVNDSWELKKV